MQIWLYQITGQVEIINGLNHYIGMKHINADMFPEFKFLGYIYGAFILLGLVVAAAGRKRFLLGYLLLLVAGAITALVDFYLWGYDYGHNLDPTAAIQVPGLSYQPPLIGHKQLLNFDAYSYPDIGGWIVISIAVVFFIILFLEWRKGVRPNRLTVINRSVPTISALATVILLYGCTPEAEPIITGKDNCAECKMTIADPKFGAEIVTKKGRIYKFDDVRCVAAYLNKRSVALSDIHQTLFVNYEKPGELVDVRHAEFVLSSQLKSPMNGNAAAFNGKASAEKRSAEIDGSKVTNWATLYNILVK
jgi:copper chaperone NosL